MTIHNGIGAGGRAVPLVLIIIITSIKMRDERRRNANRQWRESVMRKMRLQLTRVLTKKTFLKMDRKKRKVMRAVKQCRSIDDIVADARCVHYGLWILLCDCKTMVVCDVVVFIVFIFIYFDVVVAALTSPSATDQPSLSFSVCLYLCPSMDFYSPDTCYGNDIDSGDGMEIIIIIIFCGKWCTAVALTAAGSTWCWDLRRPKSNRMLDARDVRFPFCRRRQFNFSIHCTQEGDSDAPATQRQTTKYASDK